ncbi:hypothetical protein GYMLUDRAFT_56724 [Collybiopsis luxurians FD-317 M1]|nr:hypothetical protein GYMLUDRAFT_56724 [Collybiopsis luxurians FD-317 M1]
MPKGHVSKPSRNVNSQRTKRVVRDYGTAAPRKPPGKLWGCRNQLGGWRFKKRDQIKPPTESSGGLEGQLEFSPRLSTAELKATPTSSTGSRPSSPGQSLIPNEDAPASFFRTSKDPAIDSWRSQTSIVPLAPSLSAPLDWVADFQSPQSSLNLIHETNPKIPHFEATGNGFTEFPPPDWFTQSSEYFGFSSQPYYNIESINSDYEYELRSGIPEPQFSSYTHPTLGNTDFSPYSTVPDPTIISRHPENQASSSTIFSTWRSPLESYAQRNTDSSGYGYNSIHGDVPTLSSYDSMQASSVTGEDISLWSTDYTPASDVATSSTGGIGWDSNSVVENQFGDPLESTFHLYNSMVPQVQMQARAHTQTQDLLPLEDLARHLNYDTNHSAESAFVEYQQAGGTEARRFSDIHEQYTTSYHRGFPLLNPSMTGSNAEQQNNIRYYTETGIVDAPTNMNPVLANLHMAYPPESSSGWSRQYELNQPIVVDALDHGSQGSTRTFSSSRPSVSDFASMPSVGIATTTHLAPSTYDSPSSLYWSQAGNDLVDGGANTYSASQAASSVPPAHFPLAM